MNIEESLDLPLDKVLPVIQNRIMTDTTYFGVQTLKNPFDAWLYQEIIFEIKPDKIIEIGNAYGGSTLMLAHLCDFVGTGNVIGIDLSHDGIPDFIKNHPRITFVEGDACEVIDKIKKLVQPGEKVMVIEDSSHTYENTLRVLRFYSPLVTLGSYFIVEDGICHHGLDLGPYPGPYEAIESFLKENKQFEIDRSKEPFLITWNPKGYLKKRRISVHTSSFQNMKKFTERYLSHQNDKKISILDIGSQDVNGTYKALFAEKNWHYCGLDICPGPNVDIVVRDIYHWKEIRSNSFDVVISGQAFEHIEYFWLTMREIARVLKYDGLCCLIAPSSGPEHRYPVDCWRFFPDGLSALARYAHLQVIEASTCWETESHGEENVWKDSVLVCTKKGLIPYFKKLKTPYYSNNKGTDDIAPISPQVHLPQYVKTSKL